MNEFDIIKQFFTRTHDDPSIRLGIGDDAAIISMTDNYELVCSIDTSVVGVHFPKNTAAYDIGYKSLAVSISDMAAMGATPKTTLLALTLPKADTTWLQEFAQGFFDLANSHQLELIGGDITRGPLTITTQVSGLVPTGTGLRRDQAQINDDIYVTGNLGDAGLALHQIQQHQANIDRYLLNRLNQPSPRVAAGEQLRDLAHAAIDISDGLLADLQKILDASQCGAKLELSQIPLSAALRQHCTPQQAIDYALYSGDDYELCFTAPTNQQQVIQQALPSPAYRIGSIQSSPGIRAYDATGKPATINPAGYRHF